MLMLKPIRIRNRELRNRIVMPAMHLGYSPFGRVSDQLLAFYRERARGGVGMIVVGGCVINEEAGGPMFLQLKDDKFIEPMSKLAATIRDEGAAACAQLYHGGRYVHSMLMGGKTAISSSPLLSGLTKEIPREMTLDDIRRTVDDFAAAAVRAEQAGFDAVEIIASAGYLICQFLSPMSNERTDQYGGSLENRMRFGIEVLEATREATGPDFIVGLRLAGNEFVEGGGGLALATAFAAELAKHGADYLSVTGGWHETRVPQILGELPEGGYTYLSREIRQAVDIPVFIANRLGDPAIAERTLRMGLADVVCMGRPLICDPELPNKLADDRADEIVRCAACNQGCFDSVMRLRPVVCMVNARVGEEANPEPALPEQTKRVVVVGGGPAGMSAALTAARRGHAVTLIEANAALGGQIRLAAATPGKEPLMAISENLQDALWRQKEAAQEEGTGSLEIMVGAGEMSAAEILKLNPEVVIVATGAQPLEIDLPGADDLHTVQAWDVLDDAVETGRRVVVLGGGATGAETALHLARQGAIDAETVAFLLVHQAEPPELIRQMAIRGTKEITLVELQKKVGKDIGPSTRWNVNQWLGRSGIQVLTETEAARVTPDGVAVVAQDGEERVVPADTLVLALGARPKAELVEELEGKVSEVIVIGDAKKVRRALDATKEGYTAACGI